MSSSVFGAIPAKKSPQLQLVLDFLNAFSDKDFDKLSSLITDDYVHSVVPKDLGALPVTRTEWIPRIKEILGIFNEFKFEILEIVESQNVLTVHVASTGKSTTGADYDNEYVFFFEITPETEGALKVKRVKEFVNSKYTVEFFPAEKARQAAAAQK